MKMAKIVDLSIGTLVIISGLGVGMIVDNAIKIFKPKNIGPFKNIAVIIGGAAISAVISDIVSDKFGDQLRSWKDAIGDLITEHKTDA